MIVLSGTIGAGKTSLATMLAEHFGTQAFYESIDENELLPLFYENPEHYAFLLQIYFLNHRFGSIKQAVKGENNVMDRSIYEDSLLFHLNADLGRATATEVKVYDELLENMMEELPYASYRKHPTLLVYIRVSFKTMLQRIEKRGRAYEQFAENQALQDYYQKLHARYDDWYNSYNKSPKILIDGDLYNFVAYPEAKAEVLKKIEKKLSAIQKETFPS